MRLSKRKVLLAGCAILAVAVAIGTLVLLSSRGLPSRSGLTAELGRGGYRVADDGFFFPNPKRTSFLGRDVVRYRYTKGGWGEVINLMCDPQRPERVLAINSDVGYRHPGSAHYQYVRRLMEDLSGIDFEEVKDEIHGPALLAVSHRWGQRTRWGLRLERYSTHVLDMPVRHEVTLRLRDW